MSSTTTTSAGSMEYTRLGNTGLQVSRICLGMMSYGKTGDTKWPEWVLPEEEARPFVKRALELGINFFDTANGYAAGTSEEILGAAIRDFAPSRDEVVIATKCFLGMDGPYVPAKPNTQGLSRKAIMSAVEGSLKRLGTDYIDLYQIHRWDKHTPIEETMETLHDLVRSGKVRYIGASSMFAWQLAKAQFAAQKRGFTPFVSMQNHYNLIYREEEREMIPFCADQGLGVLPWSPLARGLLTGRIKRPSQAELDALFSKKADSADTSNRFVKDSATHHMYLKSNVDDNFDIIERLSEVADKKNIKSAQVALGWLLSKPNVTAPIVGATKLYQLEEAAAAVQVKLTADEVAFLEAPYKPHPVLGHSS